MPTGTGRAKLDHRILTALAERGWGVKASELAGHLNVGQRDVISRLQSLKRRGAVRYDRDEHYPGAAGNWSISEQGQQI